MTNYKQVNNLIGWLVFIAALIVYTMTLEPTVSWWDPGEYILTAYKLEIGHPPGSPTYALLGRLFSMFAFGDTSKVAFAINMLSAVCSALVIMFLFWIITMMLKKLALQKDEVLSKAKAGAIFGSGIVGAMAFAFSDSFWFSAVEAESYAVSFFCTTLVFWIALRWEQEEDFGKGLRWLIFISLIVGLAIGIHTLNLLALPAICYIVYFKRYTFSWKGFIITGLVSLGVIVALLFIIVPYTVSLSSDFELFFVNVIGLPFGSGAIIWFVLLGAALVYGIYWTHKHQKAVLNAVVLAVTFVIIGYSTFFVIVIRANADPPINENDPEDAIALLSYLNREQYGTWPLVKGQYYNAPIIARSEGKDIYLKDKKKGKYVVVEKRTEYTYDPNFTTLFPRMYSNQRKQHIDLYKAYGNIKGRPVQYTDPYTGETKTAMVPTFGENLRFFFTYQVGHMYFRYFMWNFVGRQNNIESQGEVSHGNWKSGIPFVDTPRIGPQNDLPPSMQNPANTAFYFLPLILGLIGLYYHYKTRKNDAWVIFVLFFMTGLAIIIYLNQYPLQPRERDYAYPGSFMAFCMWIGIGTYGIWDFVSTKLKKRKNLGVAVAVSAVCFLAVPTIMGSSGWESHDRHGKWAAHDWAVNYLESCAPNAILFTNGDNDTFPLWYAQEIEGVRTDVRVVNYVLAGGAWYCHQLQRKAYESEPLPLSLSYDDYRKGTNDQSFVIKREDDTRVELKDLIRFIGSDREGTYRVIDGTKYNFFPTEKVKLTIDVEAAVKSGTVPADKADEVPKVLEWDLNTDNILKNELMLLDLLANNNWERPIYFASPSAVSKVFNLDQYMHQEGMAYRLRPYKAVDVIKGLGGVDPAISYNLLVNKFRWGFLNKDNVVVDRESERNALFAKEAYRHTAAALIAVHQYDSAVQVLDKCIEFFPNKKIPFDQYMISFAEMYYDAHAPEKGDQLLLDIADRFEEDLLYYARLTGHVADEYDYDRQVALAIIQRLSQIAKDKGRTEVYEKINDVFNNHLRLLMPADMG